MTTYSDQELVAMIQEGGEKGEKAMFFMYESYFNLRHVFSKKFKLNQEEVLLAYSDAMMALRNQLLKEKYKGKGRIKKYFRRILNNKCVDIIRKRTTKDKKGKVVNLESHDLPSEGLNKEEALIEEENRKVREIENAKQAELLLKAMEQLSEKCRNILMDYLVDDLTPKQINEKYTDIKNANVARSTIYSCRKKLISAIEALQSRS